MKTLKTCKKITLATVKSFAKRNINNLYSKELSRFDGMIDCVSNVEDTFTKAKINEDSDREFISGCWLVGSSRDSFSIYEDSIYFGIRIYNCCGSSIVAVKKQKEPEPEFIDWDAIFDEPKKSDIEVIDYSEKAIAVIGNTKRLKDDFKALGGRFNFRLSCGAGWVFPTAKKAQILQLI